MKPLKYCQRICHKIGFYLQKIHGIDLVRMHVDFHVDEFGKIFLFQTKNLVIRQSRKVPTEDSTMLGDFILKKITAMN